MTPEDALQEVLAGEHAAVYVYGALGGRLAAFDSDPMRNATRAAVRSAYDTHVDQRDALIDRLRASSIQPVAAETAYALPGPATSVAEIRATSLEVETRCLALYADAVSATEQADRDWAFDALGASAVQSLSFGGAPQVLPGY